MKKNVLVVLLLILSLGFVLAENHTEESSVETGDGFDDEIYEGYEDAELQESAGLKHGDAFYFIDKFFDRFGDELTVKEERIAEIKELIEEGDIEGAKEVLKDYMELAQELEREIDPDRREDALRSAAAIRNAMKDIRDQLPPGERGRFVSDIISQEHSIALAAEIASKIRDLCIQLAELDPLEYSRMCRTNEDAPKWHRDLDKDLSEEQEKIAREFVEIMKECFETSGQDCRCDDIPFPEFANACSEAAPLAVACDIDGDERACDKLDEIDMPDLPEWLEDVWEELEEGMMEAQFDMHMPRECVESGVTSPRECGIIMIQTHAPEECKEALLAADVQNERDGREICEKIMMELHAPDCAREGITSPRECGEFMESFRGGEFRDDSGFRHRIDFDCRAIEDSLERLDCFDKASSQAEGFGGFADDYVGNCLTGRDMENRKNECMSYGDHSGANPIYGDSGEGYECIVDIQCVDYSQGGLNFDDIKEREIMCATNCEAKGGRWDFSYGDCQCIIDNYEDYGKEEYIPEYQDYPDKYDEEYLQEYQDYPTEEYIDQPPPEYDDGTGGSEETTDGGATTDSESESSSEPEPEPSSDGITGNVFLDYMYR